MSDPKASRGYRNKNPGNLNYIADPKRAWNGQIALGDAWLPEGKRRFGEYATDIDGIRATVGQLTVNQTRNGLRTITAQITRWAPAADGNDTPAYIAAVAKRVGIGPAASLDVRRYSHAKPMVWSIINHECGGMPYTDAEIDAGLAAYGITPHSEERVTTIAEAASTGTGRGAGAVAAVVAAAAPVAPLVQMLGGLPEWTAVALIAAAALLALAWVLTKRVDV